jgi:DNA-binding beta-propeller fold protein YncE
MSFFVWILIPSLFLIFTLITNNDPINPHLYFADGQTQLNHVQYSFIKKWDSQGTGNGQINQPHSIDIDLAGNVYVADTGNSRVQKLTSDGQFITQWGSEGAKDGQFSDLHDVAVSPSGKYVYTIELGNQFRIQKFTSEGQFITKWSYENNGGIESYKQPHQIAVDSAGNVFVPDAASAKVIKFDGNGKFITKWGTNGSGNGQFSKPHGVAVDSKDNVYVTDMRNSRVQKFDNNGNFITMWGKEGTDQGQFTQVIPGIDVDYSNNYVFVVDKEGADVQKFTSDGKFITKWGTEGAGDGELKAPEDVAVNSKMGTIYITDTGNSRIQIFGLSSPK